MKFFNTYCLHSFSKQMFTFDERNYINIKYTYYRDFQMVFKYKFAPPYFKFGCANATFTLLSLRNFNRDILPDFI